jgi:hypothetical protein
VITKIGGDSNPMNAYYVLRRESEFKIIYMDRESAQRWSDAGWELSSHDSNEKAQLAMTDWEANSPKATPSLVEQHA